MAPQPSHDELSGLLAEAAEPALAEIRRDREGVPTRIAEMLDYLERALFDRSFNVTAWKRGPRSSRQQHHHQVSHRRR